MLPAPLRRLAPSRLRDHPAVRGAALATGLIPPRTMQTAAEAAELTRLARSAACVVELGVYEGSSAVELCATVAPTAELHLVDPFLDDSGWALPAGWQATATASRRTVARAAARAPGGGPRIVWHPTRSQALGRAWTGPAPELVFIDGDHSPSGCREDWDVWHPHVAPGGAVAFHDARVGRPGGGGGPGPTEVVDTLFRGSDAIPGWTLTAEVDSLVVVRRDAS